MTDPDIQCAGCGNYLDDGDEHIYCETCRALLIPYDDDELFDGRYWGDEQTD
jgi:hypothetical protein